MAHADDTIQALREALELSPDNLRLRQHLAETFLGLGRFEEAEKEFRKALAQAPDQVMLKVGLARAFYQQDKNSQALVIVEDLLKLADTPAQAYVLHARLLLRAGDAERAVRQYRTALNTDPAVADPELNQQLGMGSGSADSDVVEGRVRAGWQEEAPAPETEVERPTVTFADVGGMDKVKDEIRMKIIHPLTHAELYKAYGKPLGGGILLYGPPGCGKTHLARGHRRRGEGFVSGGRAARHPRHVDRPERAQPARDLRTGS